MSAKSCMRSLAMFHQGKLEKFSVGLMGVYDQMEDGESKECMCGIINKMLQLVEHYKWVDNVLLSGFKTEDEVKYYFKTLFGPIYNVIYEELREFRFDD